MAEDKLLLQAAVTAIKSGDKVTGKRLLTQLLEANPNNENAWLWMTKVIDGPDDQIKCLERVLEINPDHELARKGIAQLEAGRVKKPGPGKGDIKPLKPVALDKNTDTKICPYCAETIKKQATVCRYCGKELDKKTESSQVPKKKTSNLTIALILSIVGICVVCGTVIPGRSANRTAAPTATLSQTQIEETATVRAQGDRSAAIVNCQYYIQDKLLSPTSADFYWETEAGQIKGKPSYWSVSGKVDAVNAFNVVLTEVYTCHMHYDVSDDTWYIDDWALE